VYDGRFYVLDVDTRLSGLFSNGIPRDFDAESLSGGLGVSRVHTIGLSIKLPALCGNPKISIRELGPKNMLQHFSGKPYRVFTYGETLQKRRAILKTSSGRELYRMCDLIARNIAR